MTTNKEYGYTDWPFNSMRARVDMCSACHSDCITIYDAKNVS